MLSEACSQDTGALIEATSVPSTLSGNITCNSIDLSMLSAIFKHRFTGFTCNTRTSSSKIKMLSTLLPFDEH